jgi:hypothetical protein
LILVQAAICSGERLRAPASRLPEHHKMFASANKLHFSARVFSAQRNSIKVLMRVAVITTVYCVFFLAHNATISGQPQPLPPSLVALTHAISGWH